MNSIPLATTTPVKDSVSDAMSRLWAKYLPEMERRVAVLEAAATALAGGHLTPEERESAHAEAHKLAGSLGTFGLQRGTEIARLAEQAFAEKPVAATAQQLSAWVAEIRSLINSRP